MSSDVISRIHSKLSELSKGQKRIAEYILENPDQAALQTASVVGKTVQVSESTVVRFASCLGYEGYPELQKALQEQVIHHLTAAQVGTFVPKPADPNGTPWELSMHCDIAGIQATMEALDEEQLRHGVDALVNAECVYLMGNGASYAMASLLYDALFPMLDDVRLVTREKPWDVQLLKITPRDVCFGISLSERSAATEAAMAYAKRSGAKTVLLTDRETTPLDLDDCFIVKGNGETWMDSVVAALSLLHGIAKAVAERRNAEWRQMMEKLEQIRETYHENDYQ